MLNGSSGSFGTPGFPGFYDNNLNCTWTFRIPADGYLRLNFRVFNTERWYELPFYEIIFEIRLICNQLLAS